jgi:hypothetical protein
MSRFLHQQLDVIDSTVQLIAYFPTPLEFEYFSRIKAEETIAKWASYDGLLNG